jgi:vacuolar-type H+-ATPase subunit I/STV1
VFHNAFAVKKEGEPSPEEVIRRLKEENELLREELKNVKKRKREEEEDDHRKRKVMKLSDKNETDIKDYQLSTVTKSNLNAPIQNISSNAKIFICFSGFKNNTPTYNKQLKKQLLFDLRNVRNVQIPAETGDREVLDSSITHIISSPSARTMKVLQGLLTGKWVMTTKW